MFILVLYNSAPNPTGTSRPSPQKKRPQSQRLRRGPSTLRYKRVSTFALSGWKHWAFRFVCQGALRQHCLEDPSQDRGRWGAHSPLQTDRPLPPVQIGNAACIVEAHARASINWFVFYHRPPNLSYNLLVIS